MEYSEINKEIIGSLGKPLGTIIQIEGVIVSGDGSKSEEDKLKIKIFKVDDKGIEKEIIITAEIFSWISVKEPEEGVSVKYIGYETGGMTGIPDKAFSYMPYIATAGFTFSIYFQVIKSIV